MRIFRWELDDEMTATACYEVHRAANLADEPHEPPMSAGTFGMYLREGFGNTPGEVWVAADADGAVTGYYRLDLPNLENLDRASGGPTVHPAARRRGIGGELLRHAVARTAANERSILESVALEDSAGDAFAQAVGAKLSLQEVRRVQYLRKIPPGKVARLRASAERAAAGYSLVSWTGPIPEGYLAATAEVFNAYADAPHAEGVEDEIWDADRVRERTGRFERAGLFRAYGVAAMHDATGEMAGFTALLVDPTSPEWAFQQLTAVIRTHRGHRLGLLVKTAMLELLAEAEPQVERISTGNADANEHMIAVNEQLGYEVVKPGYKSYEIPVEQIPASQP